MEEGQSLLMEEGQSLLMEEGQSLLMEEGQSLLMELRHLTEGRTKEQERQKPAAETGPEKRTRETDQNQRNGPEPENKHQQGEYGGSSSPSWTFTPASPRDHEEDHLTCDLNPVSVRMTDAQPVDQSDSPLFFFAGFQMEAAGDAEERLQETRRRGWRASRSELALLIEGRGDRLLSQRCPGLKEENGTLHLPPPPHPSPPSIVHPHSLIVHWEPVHKHQCYLIMRRGIEGKGQEKDFSSNQLQSGGVHLTATTDRDLLPRPCHRGPRVSGPLALHSHYTDLHPHPDLLDQSCLQTPNLLQTTNLLLMDLQQEILLR
ncbi:Hypothetical predicted protein [Xyrichtys novacula]|uniref:Uncharacterized protein n=1 Tax=Xyrichtys novacula TaxID=13765 RepID=A0AAV1G678_XYRNO|nr:Hypothetical predicted protein [Xyrichtys novacula]